MAKANRKAIGDARERLRVAIDRACLARGEAQWTNGYRSAKYSGRVADDPQLYAKEMAQWKNCGRVEATVARAIHAFAAAIRGGH